MAAEIQFNAPTGLTCYAQVRNSVGQIWNGAAFVAYNTANIATYAIAATEQGTASGYYTATMPAAVAGSYNVIGKQQVGGSVAESDPTVSTGSIEWDGAAVVSLASRFPTASYTSPPSATTIADEVLTRDVSNVEGSAGQDTLCGVVLAAYHWAIGGTTWQVYQTDGVTGFATRTLTATPGADPITGVA